MSSEQIEAFLNDLARISLRHGIQIGVEPYDGPYVCVLAETFRGYEVDRYCQFWAIRPCQSGENNVASLDPSQFSNDEKIEIMGGWG